MAFSANHRRIRAQPYLKFAGRIALTFVIICIVYTLFVNAPLRSARYGSVLGYFGVDGFDESNPSFKFTQYRKAVNKSMGRFWTSIQPEFTCPPRLLSKVGVYGDGPNQVGGGFNGNWVCGLRTLGKLQQNKDTIQPPCVVYSFVIEAESHFEAEILKKTNCSIYQYDPKRWLIGPPLELSTSSRLHFQRLTIGGEDKGDTRTLELLMELNGHRWIDVVKIDVNTGEYRALERILSDFRASSWPIGQLIVKFHVTDWETRKRSKWLVTLFELLEYRGLRLFKNEVNPYSPCCAEFSFINVNALEKFLEKEDTEVESFKQSQNN